MAAYRRVYDSRHLQADCQEPGSAPEPYARYEYGLPLLFIADQIAVFVCLCVCVTFVYCG